MLATPQLQQDLPSLSHAAPSSSSSPVSGLPQCPAGEVPEGTASLGQLFLAGGCGVKGDIQTFLGKLAASPQVRWEEAKLQHAHATRRTRRPRRPKDNSRAPPQPLPPPRPTFDVAALDQQQADASDAAVEEDGITIRLSSGSCSKRTTSLMGGGACSWKEMMPPLGKAPPLKRMRASVSAIVPSPPPTRRFSSPSPTDDQTVPEARLLHHSLGHATGLSPRSASSPELAGSPAQCAGCVWAGFPQFPYAYGAPLHGGAHVCGAEGRSRHEGVSRSGLAVDRLIYDIGDYCLSLCSDISLLCASAAQQTDSFTSPSSASPEHSWGLYGHGRGPDPRLDDGPLSAWWTQQPTSTSMASAKQVSPSFLEAFSLGVSVPSPPAFQVMPSSTRDRPSPSKVAEQRSGSEGTPASPHRTG